jgi:hypothetical protein
VHFGACGRSPRGADLKDDWLAPISEEKEEKKEELEGEKEKEEEQRKLAAISTVCKLFSTYWGVSSLGVCWSLS